ncbi:MAG: hypothetical protein CMP06_08580 [Xanthomonadales bacterium]|nr:hypothetical protein [Xanthomonadales bacterium]
MRDWEIIESICRYCHARTVFEVVFSEDVVAPDDAVEEYTVAKCRACREAAFFYREDVELLEGIHDYPTAFIMMWPTEKRYLDVELPPSVGQAYAEAVVAEKHELWLSASVMTGRALEAICKIYEPNARTIAEALKTMRNKGVLSEEMYEWSSEIRIVRNDGAHPSNPPPSGIEVQYSIDFLRSLAEILFEIRPKFKKFKAARESS